MKYIAKALEPEYTELRYLVDEIGPLFGDDTLRSLMTDNMLKQYPIHQFSEIQAQCRTVYCTLLFPNIEAELQTTISEQKLEFLTHVLKNDMTLLRRWLFGGLVLDSAGFYNPKKKPDDKDTTRAVVERVRSTILQTLGIPLLKWEEHSPGIRLDLIPSPIT